MCIVIFVCKDLILFEIVKVEFILSICLVKLYLKFVRESFILLVIGINEMYG